MRVDLIRRPSQLTRRIQPAGHTPHPARWRNGFAIWLPGQRLLLVTR